MAALKILILLWMWDCVVLQVSTGIFKSVTPAIKFLDAKTDTQTTPSSTEEKSAALTVAASGSETESVRNESFTLLSVNVSTGIFKSVTPAVKFLDAKTDTQATPSSTEEKSAALTVAASGVISFIVILVVIVIILVCVVSLRFRCHHCKDAEADKQKPQHPIVTYSCSDAENAAGMKNVLLVSMKDLSTSASEDGMKPMVTCEE